MPSTRVKTIVEKQAPLDVSGVISQAMAAAATPDGLDVRYRIQGGKPLTGTVDISGSKNAALPLIAGTLLCQGTTVLKNVPRLRDTATLLSILRFLGATVTEDETVITINTDAAESRPIPHDLVSKLRGSIVLLGPLLARFGEVEMAYPGGCVLGKRPVGAHILAFTQLGAEDLSTDTTLRLRGKLHGGEVILPEFSVTATENVLLAAALIKAEVRIELAAAEPHVQDVCKFLIDRNIKVGGVGSHTLSIQGGSARLAGGTHTVTSDYLEAGAFILAGLATRGRIRIRHADRTHLISFLGAIGRAGGRVTCEKNGDMLVDGAASSFKATRIQTNIFPGFPTDLQAPFGVLLTQAEGVSRIFEVLFEGRMAYLYELEKMGAHIEILNSHQALVIGPSVLRGRQVPSNDIRAGVAMVIAGLAAQGETVVTDVRYIERGYDRLEEKLKTLGADIIREEE
ncbi:MAG: UDP-N-acetylglucosamine 1-carboxyvinyltransferase [Candidatus Peribacteraceae bacterium]|nr:UDP-N-acetylglucosamine 1-carboxyvinyltransferase [Candidatus Peribacteraceae bacterium]